MKNNSDIPEGYKVTELGVLPEDWKIKKMGDIVDFKLGRTPPRNDLQYWDNGIYPWVSISDMSDFSDILLTKEAVSQHAYDTILKGKIIPKETLFMSFKLTIGRTSILKIDAFHNEAIAAIFPKEFEVIRDFLFYYLPTIDYSDYYDTAIKGKTLNKAKIKSLKIPLPPLPEQHAIATTLRTVQEAKEKTEVIIAATKALKVAMMKHLFTYGPVPPEDAERVVLKETEIGQVPEEWEISTLGKIAHVGNGSTPKRDNPAYWENGTIPWITSTRVHDSIITRSDFFVTELAARECHLPLVKKGSLVIAITGQGKTLGNTALVSFDTRINQHLAYVKFNDDSVVAEFMLRFMQSRYQQLRDISHSAGSTKGALTCGFLKTYPVPLPPNNVQTLIAETFSAIDQKLAAEQSHKEALDILFTSLLHDIMTAKIRVNQAKTA